MWFLLKASVIFAVCASNIHWHWTPNGYLASLIGVGLAYGATWLLTALLGFVPWLEYRRMTQNRRVVRFPEMRWVSSALPRTEFQSLRLAVLGPSGAGRVSQIR
jgi:hypothetical protein